MAKEPTQPKTITLPAPDNGAGPPLTPQERIDHYQAEEAKLRAKYGIILNPYIKKYNTGQQVADLELLANPQWQADGASRELPT